MRHSGHHELFLIHLRFTWIDHDVEHFDRLCFVPEAGFRVRSGFTIFDGDCKRGGHRGGEVSGDLEAGLCE